MLYCASNTLGTHACIRLNLWLKGFYFFYIFFIEQELIKILGLNEGV